MEKDSKKNIRTFLISLGILLLTVISATYAYFAVTTVNNFGTSLINAQAGAIGSVTLNGNSATLSMDLTALDMVQGNSDITYYASSSGKTTTPTTVTLGTASVSPVSDPNTYRCTYTLSVTHSGTNDMYNEFNSQTGNVYDYTNRSAGQIILTINDKDYDFYNAWPTSNQITGSFFVEGNQTADITASLKFINKSSIDQSYLADTDISISISLVSNSLSCTAVETGFELIGTDSGTNLPVVQLKSLPSEEFFDITNAINYSTLISTNGNIYNYASGKSVLLAKYNLLVGRTCVTSAGTPFACTEISTSTTGYGLQSIDAKGFVGNSSNAVGVVPFSGSSTGRGYWYNNGLKPQYGTSYNGSNIYDTNYTTAPNYSVAFRNNAGNANYSIAYYVEEYVNRIGINGVGRLLTYSEANALVSTKRNNGTRYWLGSSSDDSVVWTVLTNGTLDDECIMYTSSGCTSIYFNTADAFGVRPVIVVNTSDIITS